jgi:hypothetical protein
MIILNSAITAAGNQSGNVESNGRSAVRTDSASHARKHLGPNGQIPETDVTILTESFKNLPKIRYEVVEDAKEKLNAGFYGDRFLAIHLAESILDIS